MVRFRCDFPFKITLQQCLFLFFALLMEIRMSYVGPLLDYFDS